MARTFNIQMLLGAVDKASPTLKTVGKNMAVIGAAVSAATALMMKSWADAGDEIEKMARRTGIGTVALSEFKHAAELSGASLTDVEKGVKKMAKTIVDAGDGMATYVRAFDRIGISVEELDALNPEEQFIKISSAIADLESPTLRAAAAQDIFGRAGTNLLPMFDAGSEGLKAMREEAHELGIVFDEAGAKKAAEFTDNMLRLKGSMRGVFLMLAEQLFPVVNKFLTQTKGIIVKVREWMEENRELTERILKVVVGLGALMAVLGPVMLAIPTLATSFGILHAVMAANPYAMIALAIVGVTLAIEGMISASNKAKTANLDATEQLRKSTEGRIEIAQKEADEIKARLLEMVDAKKTQTDKYIELESNWLRHLSAIKHMEGELAAELLGKEKVLSEEELAIRAKKLEALRELDMGHLAITAEAHLVAVEEERALMDEMAEYQEGLALIRFEKEQMMAEELKKLNMAVTLAVSNSFQAMFHSIGKGHKTFADSMKRVGEGLKSAMIQQVSDLAANWVMQHIIMAAATKAWALATAAYKAIAAHAGIPFAGLAIGLGVVAAMHAAIKGFAGGGVAEGLTMVGERGRELINVGSPSRIFSNPETERILAGRGGLTIYNIFTGNTIMNDRAIDDFAEIVEDKIWDGVKMEQNI